MTAGDKLVCPHCHEKTIAKEKTLLDNWQVKGKFLACALCGEKLEDVDKSNSNQAKKTTAKSAERLAALLGEEISESVKLSPGEGYLHFCRNCKYFISHPFKCLCSNSGKVCDPANSCDEFELKRGTDHANRP